jgi:hypothetical protein
MLVAALFFIQFMYYSTGGGLQCFHLFRCNLSRLRMLKTINCRTASPVSSAQPADKDHHDDGHSFHDFKILYSWIG